MKQVILTGDRPTGKLHIGHYIGSLKNRVELQETGNYEMYIMIADTQAITDNAKNMQKIQDSVFEVAKDYLSVGLDPKKCTIFIQSYVPELAELTCYFSNLVTVARLQRNPTVKTEIKQKGFGASLPVGFFTYPISQAADILGFNADVVPVGDDQLPMIEQAREIAHSFNSTYGNLFVEPVALLPKGQYARRLPGIDGNAKMSKSLGNCIYLSDDEETLRKKVFSMYTDPNHININDPGKIEGNMVFAYLEAFGTDTEKIEQMKEHYQKGGLGDVACKKYLLEVLNEFLAPIRERRKYFDEHLDEVKQILIEGNKIARSRCQKIVEQAKQLIGVDYLK